MLFEAGLLLPVCSEETLLCVSKTFFSLFPPAKHSAQSSPQMSVLQTSYVFEIPQVPKLSQWSHVTTTICWFLFFPAGLSAWAKLNLQRAGRIDKCPHRVKWLAINSSYSTCSLFEKCFPTPHCFHSSLVLLRVQHLKFIHICPIVMARSTCIFYLVTSFAEAVVLDTLSLIFISQWII